MMDIVQRVSSEYFLTMNEARWSMNTRKKSEFAMKSMRTLKDSFTINPSTLVTVNAHIDDELIIENSLALHFYVSRRTKMHMRTTINRMKKYDMMICTWFMEESGCSYGSIQMERV